MIGDLPWETLRRWNVEIDDVRALARRQREANPEDRHEDRQQALKLIDEEDTLLKAAATAVATAPLDDLDAFVDALPEGGFYRTELRTLLIQRTAQERPTCKMMHAAKPDSKGKILAIYTRGVPQWTVGCGVTVTNRSTFTTVKKKVTCPHCLAGTQDPNR